MRRLRLTPLSCRQAATVTATAVALCLAAASALLGDAGLTRGSNIFYVPFRESHHLMTAWGYSLQIRFAPKIALCPQCPESRRESEH